MGTASAQDTKDYEGHWAQTTIQNWLDSGLLKGFEDGSVKPNQTITRAEFMTLVNRSYHFTETGEGTFSDVPATSWAYNEIRKAIAAGYIQGYNGEMRPNAPINRQEAAVIISKLLKLEAGDIKELRVFSDASQIASWSQGSVAAAIKAGVLKGYPNGLFAPVQALTRAEALTLIDSAATATPAATAEATQAPTPSPSASPTPTATATAAASGGGGGGGGGGGSVTIPATATPTSQVTPTPAPTATPSPTPVTEAPVRELPALDISITSSYNTSVANAVYLEIDYRRVIGTAVGLNDRISYYVTEEPVSSRDIRWELNNLPYAFTSTGYSLQTQTLTGVSIPLSKTGGAGEKYVSVLVKNSDNEVTGFYTQKVNLHSSTAVQDSSFAKLESGVTINQEKYTTQGLGSPHEYYSDIIDVTDAMTQFGGMAVAYTITPKYFMDANLNLDLNDIINASRTLYKDNQVRVIDATAAFNGVNVTTPGYIPFAYETLSNYKTYNEGEYTLVFFDADMKALGYYTGKVTLSDDLAVEAAVKRIEELPSSVALKDEDAVNRATRAYEALSGALRPQISGDQLSKLTNAQLTLENLKKSGPLQSIDLVQSDIIEGNNQLNGKSIRVYTTGLPDELKGSLGSFSLHITANPVRTEDLATVKDKTGLNYVTVVYYDKAGLAVRYTTRQIDFTTKLPVWDGTATQVQNGVELVREYGNGGRADFVNVKEYWRSHPAALYYTATPKSALTAAGQSFSPELAVQYLNDYMFTNGYDYEQIQFTDDIALNGQSEDYIVVFYDANYKALNYYIGSLTD
ncbi:hypothetical protein KC345_g8727 [Hortaea werneckii]|nr:hypothetical protein KC345_g8727 [Hortaea werneckii]